MDVETHNATLLRAPNISGAASSVSLISDSVDLFASAALSTAIDQSLNISSDLTSISGQAQIVLTSTTGNIYSNAHMVSASGIAVVANSDDRISVLSDSVILNSTGTIQCSRDNSQDHRTQQSTAVGKHQFNITVVQLSSTTHRNIFRDRQCHIDVGR